MGPSKLVLALSCFVLCIQASNPKRGIALVQSSDADLPKGSGGRCSWFYNWAASPPAGYPRFLEFVPMLWGHQDSGIFIQTVRQLGASTVLGFNEPNEYGQSNIGVPEAVQMWKAYIQPLKNSGVRLGSPAVSSGPSGLPWLVNFVASCSGCSIDFVVVHWYGEGATNFINYLASVHAQIPNKAVWVTEFACTSGNPADVSVFLAAALTYLDAQPWIERYNWFAFGRPISGLQTSLLDGGGNVNALGSTYI
ncbi:unnamed protein product [Mycena citricolor]|uniref:Asl1-like glycosyl hydrolase catalytic domain-containing protein n=1 Tax=Mycena citricolor TaxID=2018698 RepID=A0AAD2HNU2_9AGAR|nr:unnamed protein product [Mycena citricolor]